MKKPTLIIMAAILFMFGIFLFSQQDLVLAFAGAIFWVVSGIYLLWAFVVPVRA